MGEKTLRKALIFFGGWKGHEPKLIADKISEELRNKDYSITKSSDFGDLLDDELLTYDVIIPIWSCGMKGDFYLSQLLNAVKNGVGLATFHGGINWFEQEKYYEMIGAFYLYDSKPEKYNVTIADTNHPITEDLQDIEIISEKYYIQVDPKNHILAYADFSETKMPISWIKNYGKGRVFYSSLAHSPEQIFNQMNMKMILNGIDWASKVI